MTTRVRSTSRRLWSALFLLLAPVAGAADHAQKAEDPEARVESAPDRWTPELMMQVRRPVEVDLSADGKWVAYAVQEAVLEPGASEFRTQVHRSAADGSETRQLTFDAAGASRPLHSPDGKRLAFLSTRAGRNLFLMRTDGGEPWQLTAVETGVGVFIWSADGKHIVYTVGEGPSEEEAARAKDKNDAYEVGALRGNAHLWIVEVPEEDGKKGEARRLTEGDFHVNPAYQSGFDVSPDGKTVVYTRSLHPRANEWTTTDLYLVDVESGESRPLITGAAAESDPRYSPDGRYIAFGTSDDPPNWAFTADIAVVPAEGGEARILAPTHDRNRSQILGWSADSERIYFMETRGTLTRFAYLPVDGGPAVLVDQQQCGLADPMVDEAQAPVLDPAGQRVERGEGKDQL